MTVDLLAIHLATRMKKAGTKVLVPAVSWLVCPDKLEEKGRAARGGQPRAAVPAPSLYVYAVLRGRNVKSRT